MSKQSVEPQPLLDTNFLETRGFRPEIQGLRALALFLVVSYHIWFGRVSGGVDVFLFISAFLLSLSNMRKINEGKPLKPVAYWLHVFQRLLPAAATVIAATVAAAFYFLPTTRLLSVVQDAIAAMLYFLNWRLAFNSVDYYAQDAAGKTPLQHYWSLSMQGQIFVLWPLLFLLVGLLARRMGKHLVVTAAAVFGTIFAVSLAFSVYETATNQGFAYFDTRTRLWEFAAGTLLALITFKWKPPQALRVPMGWLGVIGLISCGFVLPVESSFPGYLALWPLVSAAMVILAGQTGSPVGADRILASKPFLKLGEISYALYLVHWPVFIFYTAKTGVNHPNFLVGSALIVFSMLVAWLIHRFIEQPLRKAGTRKKSAEAPGQGSTGRAAAGSVTARPARTRRTFSPVFTSLAVIGGCLLLVGTPLLGAKSWLSERNEQQKAQATQAGSDQFPGALSIGKGNQEYDAPPIPVSEPLSQYDGLTPGTCTGDFAPAHSELNKLCGVEQNTDPNGPSIMVIGGSHTGQSIAFYREVAREKKLNLIDLHTGGCRFPLAAEPHPTEDCLTYNRVIADEVIKKRPTFVALMITQTDPASNHEVRVPNIEAETNRFTEAGIKVIGLRDNPRWSKSNYECAQMAKDNLTSCSAPVGEKLAAVNPAQEMIDANELIYGLDFTEEYCPDGTCQPIIGNIYVYMDDNHIGKAFGVTLTDFALDQLDSQHWLEGV